MNLKEIKEQYDSIVDEKILRYVTAIDNIMVENYKTIIEIKKVTITEKSITRGYDIPEYIREEIIKKLKIHYEKDWDIEQGTIGRKEPCLIFTLKTEKKEIAREKLDRNEILDL